MRSSSTLSTGESSTLWLFRLHRLTLMSRHGVAEPELAEHYDKFGSDFSDEDEDEYDSDGSDGFGYCALGCCADPWDSDEDFDEDEDEDEGGW